MKVESVSKVEPFPYQRNKNTEITVCFARSKIFSWFSLCLFYTTTFSGKKESMSRILVKESHVSALISPITQVKDTNRKIRKTEFIYICGSKNGSN